jgi:hypothetical protein
MAKGALFHTDNFEVYAMARWLQSFPKKVPVLASQLLNNMAFKSKQEIEDTFDTQFILRKERFVKGSIRFTKAKPAAGVNAMFSSVHNIERQRFTAMTEQETGIDTQRKRIASKAGRGGAFTKKIKPSVRLKRRNMYSVKNMPKVVPSGLSSQTKNTIMLRFLQHWGWRKPFIIVHHKKLPPGVYKFRKGTADGMRNLELQQFLSPEKNLQPARRPWMNKSVNRMLARFNVGAEWIKLSRRMVRRRFR